MYPKSDVTVDASKFDRDGIDKQTLEFNEKLIKIWADGPRWYEVCLPIPIFSTLMTPSSILQIRCIQLLILHNNPSRCAHVRMYRSAQQPTAKCAGKAKPPSPNPSSYPKVSTVLSHLETPEGRYLTEFLSRAEA